MAHLIDLICVSIYLSALLKLESAPENPLPLPHLLPHPLPKSMTDLPIWLAQRGHMTNGSGFSRERIRERIWEQILSHVICLIGSDRSHDSVSAPASAPKSDWIGRSVTANDREGNPLPHPLPHPLPKINKFLTFDSNSTSDSSDVLKSILQSMVNAQILLSKGWVDVVKITFHLLA